MSIAMVTNLLKRHPSCKVVIHRKLESIPFDADWNGDGLGEWLHRERGEGGGGGSHLGDFSLDRSYSK